MLKKQYLFFAQKKKGRKAQVVSPNFVVKKAIFVHF